MSEENETQIKRVLIKDITLNPGFQIRAKLDEGVVKKYAAAYKQGGMEDAPVTLARIGDGLILVDGWHRLCALTRIGHEIVEARIIPATEREAQWLAARANLTHGLPLKGREYRQAFRAYIQARQHRLPGGRIKSYREISLDLGGHRAHVTIRDWMMKDFPKIFRTMSAGDDQPAGKGGLQTQEPPTMRDTVEGHLEQAFAAFRGIDKEEDRNEVIGLVEEMLEQMWDGKPGPPEMMKRLEDLTEEEMDF